MDNIVIKVIKKINSVDNTIEMEKIVEKINVNDLNEILLNSEEIDIEKIPYLLDSLYKSNNVGKFRLFCDLLEKYHLKIDKVTNLEEYPMFVEKYKMLLPTLINVANNNNSGIGDCMYLILLNSDPKGTYLEPELQERLIKGLNYKLFLMQNYIDSVEKMDASALYALEIMLDVSTYLNNEETKIRIKQIGDTNKIEGEANLFYIKTTVENNIEIDNEIFLKVAENKEYAFKLLNTLERINKKDRFPEEYLNQDYIAECIMIEWLKYPSELGKSPDEIEEVAKMEIDNVDYYIFKFTDNETYNDRGYMLGICGGFEKEKEVTANTTGYTFSKFEKIEEDYVAQAKKIIKLINNHWKKH